MLYGRQGPRARILPALACNLKGRAVQDLKGDTDARVSALRPALVWARHVPPRATVQDAGAAESRVVVSTRPVLRCIESFATEINGRLVPCKPLLMSTEQKKSALVRLGYFGEASYTSIGEPFDTKRAGASTPGLGLPCGRRLGPSPALASTDNATQSMRVY
jgi:hypothetical protein